MNRYAKKSLGQNFLIDTTVIDKIVQAVPDESPLVLEIGPGRGAITYRICDRAKTFCVIEKDDVLVEGIRTELGAVGKGQFIWHGDALEFPYPEIWSMTRLDPQTPLIVVGNLPYNVATEILLRILPLGGRISKMVLMFQREVGFRLAGQPNSKAYSSLSILTQNWFEVKTLVQVKPAAFKPAPKVDSAVLEFNRRTKPLVDLSDAARYLRMEKMLRACFAYRRKTIENSLQLADGGRPWKIILERANIEGKRRAENLAISEFIQLLEAMEDLERTARELN